MENPYKIELKNTDPIESNSNLLVDAERNIN